MRCAVLDMSFGSHVTEASYSLKRKDQSLRDFLCRLTPALEKMIMPVAPRVPDRIRNRVLAMMGDVLRNNVEKARSQMAMLGVRPGSEFYAFFSEFTAVNLTSVTSDEYLRDVADPTPQIAASTGFVREVWELPSEYICMTSCEGEGGYLYSTVTEAVYDFSLALRESFLASPTPAWPTFFTFLEWYLAQDEPGKALEPCVQADGWERS